MNTDHNRGATDNTNLGQSQSAGRDQNPAGLIQDAPVGPAGVLSFDSRLTASQLGRLAGQDRYAIRRRINVPPSGALEIQGNKANAWRVAEVPPEIRERIDPYDLAALSQVVESWKNRLNPTQAEKAALLDCAFLRLQILLSQGAGHIQKARQIDWLLKNVPALGSTEGALRRAYNRYHEKWRSGGIAALYDQRKKAAKIRRAPKLPKDDLDRIVWTALNNTKLSANHAWQICWHLLSQQTKTRYPLRRQIPIAVRKQVVPEIARLADTHIRPRHARLNGASLRLDHSGYHAGDFYSADDLTLEVYFYVEDGAGWFDLTRGQVILFIDCRSKRILDFALVPQKSFSSEDVRALTVKVCERYGIPRGGFHFERNIFDAKLTGKGAYVDPYADRTETFADRLGIKIIHAIPGNARAKIIENVNKLFQRFLAGEVGYVGSNEQDVKHERAQDLFDRVRRGKSTREHPGSLGLRSVDEWYQRLQEVCEEYNRTQQYSEVMGGDKAVLMSPDEAWEVLQPRNDRGEVCGMTRITPENRHLLACHVEARQITRQGITLKIGSKEYRYVGEATARRRFETVKCWFDPERPESLIITDLKGENMDIVSIAERCKAFVATPDEIHSANSLIQEHQRALRTRYSELRKKFVPPAGKVICKSDMGARMEELRRVQETRTNLPNEVELKAMELQRRKSYFETIESELRDMPEAMDDCRRRELEAELKAWKQESADREAIARAERETEARLEDTFQRMKASWY